ncbi:unnamed protein product [Clonostachys rosea f. rosea IK726]|uniref:Uncharacterized protein n=1 Tax=Clonostachys rosea f. rosea IK726 TaxID=1349383 RepID=A0ACA9TTQ0_BIOOC|nr:unnamed protein product [Clonostachys rosea f. rosea IK726]
MAARRHSSTGNFAIEARAALPLKSEITSMYALTYEGPTKTEATAELTDYGDQGPVSVGDEAHN